MNEEPLTGGPMEIAIFQNQKIIIFTLKKTQTTIFEKAKFLLRFSEKMSRPPLDPYRRTDGTLRSFNLSTVFNFFQIFTTTQLSKFAFANISVRKSTSFTFLLKSCVAEKICITRKQNSQKTACITGKNFTFED